MLEPFDPYRSIGTVLALVGAGLVLWLGAIAAQPKTGQRKLALILMATGVLGASLPYPAPHLTVAALTTAGLILAVRHLAGRGRET